MIVIQYVALACSLIFLLVVFWTILRGYLREGYALLWILVTAGMIVLALAPELLKFIAAIVEIKTPAFVLLLFMLGSMVILMFQQSLIISRHNEKVKRLTEEITLLKNKVDSAAEEK